MTTCIHSFAQLSNQDLLDLVKRLAADSGDGTPHRVADGSRRASALPRRRLFVALNVLHAGAAPSSTPRRTHRSGESGAAFPAGSGAAGGRSDHADGGRPARAAFDRRQPCGAPELRAAQDQAGGRRLVAQIDPRPDVPSSIRRLPAPKSLAVSPARGVDVQASNGTERISINGNERHERTPPVPLPSKTLVTALAPERYKVQFTVGRETLEKLRRARTCCDTPFRTAIRLRSSIERSRCSSQSWIGPGWPRRSCRGQTGGPHQARATSPRL